MEPKNTVEKLAEIMKETPLTFDVSLHLDDMLFLIKREEKDSHGQPVIGEKAHRWVGFIQGVLWANGANLVDLKQINKEA